MNKNRNPVKRLRQGKVTQQSVKERIIPSSSECVSAGIRLFQFAFQEPEVQNLSTNPPFNFGLLCNNLKDVELIFSLLNAARNISSQKLDLAENLLSKCIVHSSSPDNSLERVVNIFAEALQGRIQLERRRFDLEKKRIDMDHSLLYYQFALVACAEKSPSFQVVHFTAIEAILDSVKMARIIHLIDLGTKIGLHWSILMEALSNRRNCPLELLKITAVATYKDRTEETGRWLSSFAESLNFPLLYRTVLLSDVKELEKNICNSDSDEAIVVHLELHLGSLLAWPNHLKEFIQFIKKLNPCVIVVHEIEANTDTSDLFERVSGALSFTLATFDCLETCLSGYGKYWKMVEDVFFRDMIWNIVTAEDEERIHRHAKIGFWRKLFLEFDLVEKELSESSWYQARLLLKTSPCWDSCTVHMDGKCMIVEWKGTPLHSISAWKLRAD